LRLTENHYVICLHKEWLLGMVAMLCSSEDVEGESCAELLINDLPQAVGPPIQFSSRRQADRYDAAASNTNPANDSLAQVCKDPASILHVRGYGLAFDSSSLSIPVQVL